jgi:hypothetical protein
MSRMASGNREDVIVKSEVVEMGMMSGIVMPFRVGSYFLLLNYFT